MTKLIRVSLLSLAAVAAVAIPAAAQDKGAAKAEGGQSQLERGKYLVENVAMCELCHTARDENGKPDREHWLMGGPAQLRPAYASPYWALVEPRLAGRPPGTRRAPWAQ